MSGQPVGFNVIQVLPTEPGTAEAPALVVQVNDSVTLKTYIRISVPPSAPAVPSILRPVVESAITTAATGKVEYHLQDLATGAMVPTRAGPTPVRLSANDARIALGTGSGAPTNTDVVAGDIQGLGLDTDIYFLSGQTTPFTTGDFDDAADLKLATATSVSGSWRVLTHCHGGAGSQISAFDDNLLITVIT